MKHRSSQPFVLIVEGSGGDSSDDWYPVEVIYTDMECLAPAGCLSSTVMNFYIWLECACFLENAASVGSFLLEG
ncbi:hypothetical protein L1987_64941 [Smallanthus sonchifolius]|uniref:Uncharacterized protein n=1 Tax=Smallanthus sonchifolius TaxID=185202 RepID=A0ACB9BT34_9ASTR|nr:hypothetical protein L1987_64941 [Smallanthus sonchifolius]